MSQFLENRRLLADLFPRDAMDSLMRLCKESLEERLIVLSRESSEEEFKEVVGLLHLLATGTGQDNLSQIAGLLLSHLETELAAEQERLDTRVRNLKSYASSFDTMDDAGYTLLFADALLNGLGIFFSVLELERGLKVFRTQNEGKEDKVSRGFALEIGTRLTGFVEKVLELSRAFFEVDYEKLTEAQKQLFIIVDNPSSSHKSPNKFEWPEIQKLETFLKESCLIIQQTRLFLEEIRALYAGDAETIFKWITEDIQTLYLLKASRTQSLSNFYFTGFDTLLEDHISSSLAHKYLCIWAIRRHFYLMLLPILDMLTVPITILIF